MAEEPADGVASPAIERALTVYERLRPLEQAERVQARKVVTQHIYGMIAEGEMNEDRLVVGGLSELKRRERELKQI